MILEEEKAGEVLEEEIQEEIPGMIHLGEREEIVQEEIQAGKEEALVLERDGFS